MKKIVPILLLIVLSNNLFAQEKEMKFFKKIIYELFYHKPLRKQIKKSFKNSENPDLSVFIGKFEEGENPDKIQALEETPFSMYMFLGFWYGCYKENKDKKSTYFSVANEYEHNNTLSSSDIFLAKKIIDSYNRFSPCKSQPNITSLKELSKYAKSVKDDYERDIITDNANWKQDANICEKDIKKLYIKLERTIDKIDSLKKLVANKSIEITGLTSQNYKQAISEALQFKDSGSIKLPGTITKNLYGGAILKAKDEISVAPLSPSIVESGFEIGKFCTQDIITSTNEMISAILAMVEFEEKYKLVPLNYKDSVIINLTLTGKSDGYRIGKTNGISNMKYKENEKISGTYYSHWVRKNKTVEFSYGSPIYDDDLSFLRCDCSYKQAKKLLQDYSFPEQNLKTKYFAKVFDKTGGKYRGVDIDIEIENLFAYNLDKINILRKQQEEIEEDIALKEREKKDLDNNIEKNNQILKSKRDKVTQYVKSIIDNKSKAKRRTKKRFRIFN